jgi:peroxiredoxin (alkyl hydroperoxide reductase subunit C)
MPTIGEPAPNFTLPSTSGHDVTLSSFRGTQNVLVAFFPLAFTGVCTKEMERMTVDLHSGIHRRVSRAHGVLIEEKTFAKRSYVLVDKQGVLGRSHVEAENGHRRERRSAPGDAAYPRTA